MDVRCPKCGESWDHDELHHAAEITGETYAATAALFRRVGCEVFGTSHGEMLTERSAGAGLVYELLGDDMDGAAAMFEDMEAFGW